MINTRKLVGKIAEAGYTRKELAREMNMSANTIGKKIKGEATFDTDEVTLLCTILEITSWEDKVAIFLP